MALPAFKLERFFAKWEFKAKYLACCSDCQPLTVTQLLALASPEQLELWGNLTLGYTETQGLPALREAVAAAFHTSVRPEHLVILAPEEGVYLSMRALLSPGDHLVVTYPGYQSLYEVAASIGCSVSRWEPEAGPGGALSFDVDTLKALVTSSTKMVVMNFPHNPTGATLSRDQLQSVVGLCRQYSAWLFSDEMYRLLELDEGARLPSAADVYERAVALSGVSKALAAPGLRIGWIACRDAPFISRLMELKDYTTICSSAPSEVLALMAVANAQHILSHNLALIRSNISACDQLVRAFPDVFEWTPPVAGSVAFPRLKTGEDVEAFCERLVQSKGVLLLPASVYDHPPSSKAGHFRLGLGRANLPECLSHLRDFLVAEGHMPKH